MKREPQGFLRSGLALGFLALCSCSAETRPPISEAEGLAIGVALVMDRENLSPAEVYISNGVMRQPPDADDSPWLETTRADSYEARVFDEVEREKYRELGMEVCELGRDEDLPCPGLGSPGRRNLVLLGGRPFQSRETDQWSVPITILYVSRGPPPEYWMQAILIGIEEQPQGSHRWVAASARRWFSEN